MSDRTGRYVRKRNVLPLFAVTMIIGISASALLLSGWLTSRDEPRVSEVDPSPLVGPSALIGSGGGSQITDPGAQPPAYLTCPGAFQFLWPQQGAPPNRGTVHVGDKFVLDLMTYGGPNDSEVVSQQAYLSFTYALMQNVSVTSPGCAPEQTITPDLTTFDATLQNEVCNSPSPICSFRDGRVPPGSMAYALESLKNSAGVGYFRVAQMAFCATNPGQAIIHWQFDTVPRHTEVDPQGIQMAPVFCYEDYTINIVPSK